MSVIIYVSELQIRTEIDQIRIKFDKILYQTQALYNSPYLYTFSNILYIIVVHIFFDMLCPPTSILGIWSDLMFEFKSQMCFITLLLIKGSDKIASAPSLTLEDTR